MDAATGIIGMSVSNEIGPTRDDVVGGRSDEICLLPTEQDKSISQLIAI
jgi:hypothetical protein